MSDAPLPPADNDIPTHRRPIANNLAAIRTGFESAGVTLLADGQAAIGEGVSLRR